MGQNASKKALLEVFPPPGRFGQKKTRIKTRLDRMGYNSPHGKRPTKNELAVDPFPPSTRKNEHGS